ncbi:MAG TPA: hypothetical protein VND64_18870 [Pirellulales bacterium]|nr:hypothetical protein [Pirellulales bacterium]
MFRRKRGGKFVEGRKWVAAKRLLIDARKSGRLVPVIFAPAEAIRDLAYWGILDGVTITETADGSCSTTVLIRSLTRIAPPRPNKTALVVVSTGRKLSADHIRPYVLVQTPRFISTTRKK